MLQIILQTIIFQLLFLVVYDLFLKKETFFNYNRLYLLITSVLSFIIPFIKIDSFNKVVSNNFSVSLPEVFIGDFNQKIIESNGLNDAPNTIATIFSISSLCILVSTFALLFFIYKLYKIVKLIYKNEKTKADAITIVHLKNTNSAFSFFNFIFLGNTLTQTEKNSIIAHERIHVQQKHTLDLLWFEVLKIIFWFNPLVYLYQNRISLLHEFIADQNAVKTNKSEYYKQLLQQVFNVKNCSFINPFFKQSLIKKRIIMLQKSSSKQVNLIKYLLIIPMVFGMLVFASCVDSNSKQTNVSENKQSVDIPFLLSQVKEQIAFQGNISDKEDEAINLLLKVVKGKEFDPKLVEEVHQLIGRKDKSDLEAKLSNVFDAIQIKGDISNKDEDAIKDLLLVTTENSFNDPYFADALKRVEIPFGVVEKTPIFPGCDKTTEEENKKCFAEKITKHATKNFNAKIADSLALKKGLVRLIANFKIDADGNIAVLKVKAPHKDLEQEVKRVLNLLPKMTPGMQEGKKVGVNYTLPINFKIN
ncbi:M56 family metallopeptidase [Olleya sp. R77988]|uniref:M56 family metallopeptidase n=1 Tax=Olleya sp. R77988 TaxID=3093875 RepID=UPI0037CB12AC